MLGSKSTVVTTIVTTNAQGSSKNVNIQKQKKNEKLNSGRAQNFYTCLFSYQSRQPKIDRDRQMIVLFFYRNKKIFYYRKTWNHQ